MSRTKIYLHDTNHVINVLDKKTNLANRGVAFGPENLFGFRQHHYQLDKDEYIETESAKGYFTRLGNNYFDNIADKAAQRADLIRQQQKNYHDMTENFKLIGHNTFPSNKEIESSKIISLTDKSLKM